LSFAKVTVTVSLACYWALQMLLLE
jgi:hypothetical protein